MTFLAAAVAFALWAVLATTACLAMHRARQAQTPAPEPDAEWLDAWAPADEAEQAVYDRLFDRIIAMDAQADQ